MQAPSRSLFVAFSLLLIAAHSTARIATEEAGDRVQRVAAGLAGIGYEVELSALTLEASTARRSHDDLLALRDLYFPPANDQALPELLGALGDWGMDSIDERRAAEVKELGRKRVAYYHPERRALVMLTSKDTVLGRLNRTDFVVAHELVRAWRDARSDLRASFAERGRTQEASWILRCVLEGEARLAAIAADLQAMGGSLDGLALEDLDDPLVQAYPEEHLSLACTHGTRLALQRWHEGGWGAVRGMWDDAPPSTEQILHLEKRGVDRPTEVLLPDWSGAIPGSELVVEDRFGELGILVLLERLKVERHEARAAAAGWDGDAFRLYRTIEGEPALFWRTVWDREADAEQFARVLEAHGDGELRVRERVVDWARTVEGSLADRLLALAEGTEQPLQERAAEALETETGDEGAAGQPHVTGERWVHPAGDLSLPVPERWKAGEFRGVHRLVSKLRKHAGASFAVTPLPGSPLDVILEERRRELEALGFTVELAERRELDGRACGWLRYRGTLGKERRAISALVPGDEPAFAVTATVPAASWEELEPVLAATLEGLRFGTEAHPRPARALAEEEERDLQEAFFVRAIDPRTRTGLPDVDVWVADHVSLMGLYNPVTEPVRLEAEAHRIGHRFRTGVDGRVRIHGGWLQYPWICARRGDLFGFVDPFPDAGEEITLPLPPDRELVVRVVDEAGYPVAGVPVGLVTGTRGGGYDHATQERATEGDKGEAHFPHVFAEVPSYLDITDTELFVTFAFPLQDRPLVPLALDATLDEPVELVLPPTGSLLVQVEISEEERQAKDSDFADGRPGLVYIACEEVDGDLDFRQVRTPADREFRSERSKVLFPHVGLGLELDVTVGYGRESKRFKGPGEAGQRVEVTTRPGKERDYATGGPAVLEGANRLTGRCLHADGRPFANQEFLLTLAYRESEVSSGCSYAEFETDEEGRFECRSHQPARAGVQITAVVQSLPKAELALECVIDPWDVPAEGDHELGDLRFVPSPVVVAGRVVDESGGPVANASCFVNGSLAGGPDSEWKTPGIELTDENGSFLIRGALEGGGGSISVRAEGFHHSRNIPFTPGDRDVVVRLEAIEGVASIRGTLWIEGLEPLDGLSSWGGLPSIEVESLGFPRRDTGQVSHSVSSGAMTFTVGNLEPGRYRIKVLGSFGGPPLVPPIDVRLEPGGELRLRPIDLSDRLHRIVITLVDQEGAPVDATAVQQATLPRGFSTSYLQAHDGVLRLVADPEGVDLILSAPKHRRVTLRKVREDARVVMLPALEVLLVLDERVVLPDPAYQLFAQLVPVGPGEEKEPTALRRSRTERVEVVGREIGFELGDLGLWRVTWAIGRQEGGQLRIQRDLRPTGAHLIEVVDLQEPQVFGIPQPSSGTIERLIKMLER